MTSHNNLNIAIINPSPFRFGSFRQGTISDRLQDPQGFKPGDSERSQAPQLPVCNPNAVARPRASDLMYLRQASFRGRHSLELLFNHILLPQ